MLINSALLFSVYVLFGMDVDVVPYSYVYLLLVNTYMLINSRRNFLLFIVFFVILFSNYSIIFSNYIVRFDNTVFTDVLSQETSHISINILTLFNLFLFIFVRWNEIKPNCFYNIFVNEKNEEKWTVFILGLLLVAVFFLGFTLPEVDGERGSPSPLYEYSLIFFILFFFYSGLKRKYLYLGLFLIVMYSLQNFVFGGRILGLQFMLCAYIMLFMHKLKMPIVIIAIVIMFVLMSIIGVVRGELLSGNADVGAILSSLLQSGFALDTAYAAYYTSESFVYIIDKFSNQEIFFFFCDFVKSFFVGANPDLILPSLSENYVHHYGGGICPFYFYFYLRTFGVLLAGLLVSFYLNIILRLSDCSSGYLKCLAVWIVSTTFRWYLYTPLPLLRGVLILTIAYYLFYYFHFMLDRLPFLNRYAT